MAWPKGKKKGYRTGGRVKGKPNRVTQDIREMIRGALNSAGGEEYLLEQAREKPAAFLALVARMVPSTVNAEISTPEPVQIQVVTGFDSGPHNRG